VTIARSRRKKKKGGRGGLIRGQILGAERRTRKFLRGMTTMGATDQVAPSTSILNGVVYPPGQEKNGSRNPKREIVFCRRENETSKQPRQAGGKPDKGGGVLGSDERKNRTPHQKSLVPLTCIRVGLARKKRNNGGIWIFWLAGKDQGFNELDHGEGQRERYWI